MKKKITILGGGMAGLSAAYQLTKTQALRDMHEVTLYQMGWRLGGKAASGRDSEGRNLEHGLHVWFGCYENTFQLIQEVYAARQPATGWALATWQDAVKPQDFTPIGVQGDDNKWSYWPLTWATNDGVPGDGTLLPTLWEMIETIADWIRLYLEGIDRRTAGVAVGAPPRGDPRTATPSCILATVIEHLRSFGRSFVAPAEHALQDVVDLITRAHDAHKASVGTQSMAQAEHTIIGDVLNIFMAVVKGVFADLVVPDAPFLSLDTLEFRAWLLKHGADPVVVATSSVVRLVYDTLFQYREGDVTRPDMAAGTGLGVIMRLVGTYKGSMMWLVQAGMGEVIVGPLYQHLINAGVTFKFFHKVVDLQADNSTPPLVDSIVIEQQAVTTDGSSYRPVTQENGLILWPSEPHWDQLKDGALMQQAGVNFESHWNDWPAVPPPVVLKRGQDFDIVVLAIALGALKHLNSDEPSMCQSLMAKSNSLANWINNVGIVPSMAVQLWSNQTTSGLGWTQAKPATVAGPEYLNIWADMTQVVAFENWPEPKPLSLHYLTGTYATQFYKQPASAKATPALALADVRQQTINWLNASSVALWPAARADGHFDWNMLQAAANIQGVGRLDAQFIRANIDPTECTTLSGTGTTRFRLHADETGIGNLIVAGEGTAMGLTTSFEGAVMSGAAASRAICGSPSKIVGYDFLERKPSEGPGQ